MTRKKKKCPPQTAVFMGQTGVGKTSTINRLFGQDWPVRPDVATTKAAATIVFHSKDHPDLRYESIQFVDLMGVGESVETNDEYYQVYRHWMKQATIVFWITSADRRVYKQDEVCLEQLSGCFENIQNFYVGLNKADLLISALDLKTQEIHDIHDRKIAHSFSEKIRDVHHYFNSFLLETGVIVPHENIIPYSAGSGWQLESVRQLFFKGESHA